jgi:hypothetical protein
MRFSWCVFIFIAMVLVAPVVAQKPTIFDVTDVVVGAQRIPTRWLFAAGRWSDADEHIGPTGTQILCYKSLGFCDEASADWGGSNAYVRLTFFDILRWDSKEIIAVDSSPICVVNTLRADLITQRITLSSSDKGVTKGPSAPFCKELDKLPTAVLWGVDEAVKDAIDRKKTKK